MLSYDPELLLARETSEIDYRCRGCGLSPQYDPKVLYQTQKVIQNTVRVPSSLYTMNMGALTSYQKPKIGPQLVTIGGTTYPTGGRWNQMSDRKEPHIQTARVADGGHYHTSSTKRTITSNRPGALAPGGVGVDIKHNSYARRLNRLKGKGPLKRGLIPPNYGVPVPFNPAYPIYGGKEFKANIVSGCNCPGEIRLL
jgi:hypothetical protein